MAAILLPRNEVGRFTNPVPGGRYRKGGSSMAYEDRYDKRPREMHKAVCSSCKKECEVPFKPSGDRPIYCKDCYAKKVKR